MYLNTVKATYLITGYYNHQTWWLFLTKKWVTWITGETTHIFGLNLPFIFYSEAFSPTQVSLHVELL